MARLCGQKLLSCNGDGCLLECRYGAVALCRHFLLSPLSSFACPKEETRKGTPASPGPTGFPYFSTRAGRGKTRASPSNSRSLRLPPAFFPPPSARRGRTNGGGRKIPLACCVSQTSHSRAGGNPGDLANSYNVSCGRSSPRRKPGSREKANSPGFRLSPE